MKKILILLLTACMLLSFTGCSFYSLMMDPDDYTVASYNIVWTSCEGEIEKELSSQYSRVFYRITDVPMQELVACKWRPSGIGSEEHAVLMKRKDFEENFELDASDCKLVAGRFSVDDWMTYGEQIMKHELTTVDPDIASRLIESIAAAEYVDRPDYGSRVMHDGEYNMLRITFAIKGYEHLLWTAFVLKFEDQYYIQINEQLYAENLLLCSDELAAVIEQAWNEYTS